MRRLVAVGSALSVAGTAHLAWNLRRLRVPPADPPPVDEPVAVLIPARDEAARIGDCLRSVLAQDRVRDLRVVVLDDGSTDGTAEVARRTAGADPRVTVLTGAPLPEGWWGKPWACQQLADSVLGRPAPGDPSALCALLHDTEQSMVPAHHLEACALLHDTEQSTQSADHPPTLLVFVDADVVLAPHAVASAVTLLRWSGLDLVSPYPRQLAGSPGERLVQPLLQWSWLTTLPLRVAERSPRESLAAANGQLLVLDAAAYRRAGGHTGVRDEMLEDVTLLRAVKRAGGRGTVVDGTALATCRMYDGWAELREGYAKSLWSAFGSPAGAAAVVGALGVVYVLPPLAAMRGSRAGAVGYAAAVAGRALAARRTGSQVWPDSLAHPASVAAFGWLVLDSVRRHRAGTLTARGRPLR